MLRIFRAKHSKVLGYFLLGLVMIGLAGFGLGGAVSGLSTQNVARVGEAAVGRVEFLRAFNNELQRVSAQIGQPLNVEQGRAFGIDQQVLGQLIGIAALDDEARRLGISAGDVAVRDALLEAPALQGLNGGFDPEAYAFMLDRAGLDAAKYEQSLRKGLARELLGSGIVGAVEAPPAQAAAFAAYLGTTRDITLTEVTAAVLETPPAPPTEAEIAAYFSSSATDYMSPKIWRVEYVLLSHAGLSEGIDPTEDEISAAYEARRDQYVRPARRALSRIAFGTADEAAAARARLDASDITFDALGTERGLSATDTDIGILTAERLDLSARGPLFAADAPGIHGPFETTLGYAIFRINAVLAEEVTPIATARAEIREQLVLEAADQLLGDQIGPIEDLLASGATLAELAAETPMQLHSIDLTEAPGEGVAADGAFRAEAMEAEVGEDRDLIQLDDGSLAVLRLEAIVAPAQLSVEEVQEEVAADLKAQRLHDALLARAEAMQARLNSGVGLWTVATHAGLLVSTQEKLGRNGTIESLPASAVVSVFALESGGSTIVEEAGRVYLISVTGVNRFDALSEAGAAQLESIRTELRGQLAEDHFSAYATVLRNRAGVTINQGLLDSTLGQLR